GLIERRRDDRYATLPPALDRGVERVSAAHGERALAIARGRDADRIRTPLARAHRARTDPARRRRAARERTGSGARGRGAPRRTAHARRGRRSAEVGAMNALLLCAALTLFAELRVDVRSSDGEILVDAVATSVRPDVL